jgi:hypothetical protein
MGFSCSLTTGAKTVELRPNAHLNAMRLREHGAPEHLSWFNRISLYKGGAPALGLSRPLKLLRISSARSSETKAAAREHFSHYYALTPEQLSELSKTAIIAFDASFLLDLYRYSPEQ